MLEFIQAQPSIVDRLLRHIELPAFVDLIGRILQLDESIPNCNVIEVYPSYSIPFYFRILTLILVALLPKFHGSTSNPLIP